jgi:hypothetical protein
LGATAPALLAGVRTCSRVRERLRPVINLIVRYCPDRRGRSTWPAPDGSAAPARPIFDDCGLNVTVISYLDHVDFGFIGCKARSGVLDLAKPSPARCAS